MAYAGTNFSTPKLDGQALRRVTSQQLKENIFQNILAVPEKGVTEKFSTDVNASEIQIIRQVAPAVAARQLGAPVNGGYFNSATPLIPQSVEYGIKLLYMIDDQIDYPAVMEDMVSLPVAEATNRSVAGIVARNINASTLAHQLTAVINEQVAGNTPNFVTMASATAAKEALVGANVLLDDGDSANDIDAFPSDGRQAFIRPSLREALMASGQVIIGGSNYAQEMLAKGVIDKDTYQRDTLTGYIGEVDGLPVVMMAKVVWDLAESYMQLTAGKLDAIVGLVVAGMATGRALAFNDSVKIIDCPRGQGKTAQYKYRWGIEVLNVMGIVPIYNYGKSYTDITSAAITILAPASH